MRPNVLLIVLDAARADHFEPYGAPRGRTPVLADLAARGEFSENVYAAASWTIPSHAAMFSGRLPRSIGMGKAPGGTAQGCLGPLEANRELLLASVLGAAGYESRAVTTNAWLQPGCGFDTGFERYELVRPSRRLSLGESGGGARSRGASALESIRARADDGATQTFETLSNWIAEPRERPFFWFVNLVEAHSPYLPPAPFNSLGPVGRYRALEDVRRYQTIDAVWKSAAGLLDLPEASLERMRRLYRDSIRALDHWVGKVLDLLDGAGCLADTQVLVTSDHGENLGEGGMLGHAFSLDDRLLRVPLISNGPSPIGSQSVTSLADVPRLIADAIDLQDHPWHDRDVPDGTAVAQFDPPTGPDDPRLKVAMEMWDTDERIVPVLTSRLTAAMDGRLKLIRRGDSEEAYDLLTDPLEASPLNPEDPSLGLAIEGLRAALSAAEARESSETFGAASAAPTLTGDEAADLEERMRLLGYL